MLEELDVLGKFRISLEKSIFYGYNRQLYLIILRFYIFLGLSFHHFHSMVLLDHFRDVYFPLLHLYIYFGPHWVYKILDRLGTYYFLLWDLLGNSDTYH